MRYLILSLLVSLATGTLAAADCLTVIRHTVGQPEEGYGIVEIEWHAEVQNSCRNDQYATLTLDFLDAEGKRVHESTTDTLISPGPAIEVTKLAMLDPEQAERIVGTRVRLEARPLP